MFYAASIIGINPHSCTISLFMVFYPHLDIQAIMDPKGAECYAGLGTVYQLKFPFSLYFIQQLETYKVLFKETTERLLSDSSNLSPNTKGLSKTVLEQQRSQLQFVVAPLLAEYGKLFSEYRVSNNLYKSNIFP